MKFRNLILFAFAAFFLASCGLKDRYQQPNIDDKYKNGIVRDNSSTDTTSLADVAWRDFFTDPNLQALIDTALKNNYDLKNAILQIGMAQSAFRQSKLNFLPSINFAPTITFNNGSRNAMNMPSNVNIKLKTTTVQLGVTADWEIDIWGKLASQKRASLANWLSMQGSKNAVQTALISQIAKTYYTLLALDKQLKVTQETITLREKAVETIDAMFQSGKLTSADLDQAKANLYAAKVIVPELKQSIREMENQLSALVAAPLGTIKRGTLDGQQMNTELKTGIPMLLLANRPDVYAAEMDFRREYELVNYDKAAFYPAIRLNSGSAGISSLTTNTLFDVKSFFANIVGGLFQPIFNRGQLKANLEQQKLRQQMALNTFMNTLIKAGVEVSNAMYAYQTVEDKKNDRTQQVEALQKAVEANESLLELSSKVNYTDVLVSEQNLLVAQLSQINDQLFQYEAMIELYRALGGGWKK